MEGAWNEDDYRLCELGLRRRSKLTYEYDFGDGWEHLLVLEKVLPEQADFVPVCLDGAGACPPEDSGGPWGYAMKLEALANPKHPEHEEMVEWMGEHFDPAAFNREALNADLARLSRSWTGKRGRRK